ncbi:unnamed protein product [Paramecium sonneborni]|uniref:Transmembrane protein n=1 Tax=Paramecium sonneborni TaxID=65129 RepID=A0A8S1PCV7_9CILI|nr:unnamed protein product [Paramecium sonneborni]
MQILSQIISTILFFSTLTIAQDLISLGNQCSCQQLTSQIECQYFIRCQFIDQVCSQKSCDQMNFQACQTTDCAWNKGKCSKFTKCQDYEVTNEQDCLNLRNSCIYNNLTKSCTPQEPLSKKCSEQEQNNCYYGIDGKCIYKDNKCQIWIDCEDAEYGHCAYGNNHCFWNTENDKCLSVQSCEQIEEQLCLFAFPDINKIDAYICQYDKNGKCQNFNPSNQNLETCIAQSYGYYQWINGKCTSCQSSDYDVITSALFLTILLIY